MHRPEEGFSKVEQGKRGGTNNVLLGGKIHYSRAKKGKFFVHAVKLRGKRVFLSMGEGASILRGEKKKSIPASERQELSAALYGGRNCRLISRKIKKFYLLGKREQR